MHGFIDETTWPYVTVRWEGTVEDATLSTFLLRMDGWLARGERFALLIDSRGARGFSPEQRTRVIAHMKERAHDTARYLTQAIVLDNMIQRTLFQWVNLLFPSPFPTRVFGDVTAARTWLEREFERRT